MKDESVARLEAGFSPNEYFTAFRLLLDPTLPPSPNYNRLLKENNKTTSFWHFNLQGFESVFIVKFNCVI